MAALHAGVHLGRGEVERGRSSLLCAATGFRSAGLAGFEMAARDRLAHLPGGDSAGHADARSFLAAQGVMAPERYLRTILPGL
jgi:hypothetical protein